MKLQKTFHLITVLFISSVYSQTCCSGGIPLSNNIGIPNEGKGSLQISLNYDYNNLNTLNFGSSKLDDNSRLRITHSVLLNVGYSFSNNFSAEALITWVNQRRKISRFNSGNLDQTSGVGDAILLLKYKFPKIFGVSSSLGFGTKISVGSTTNKSDNGIILNADLQPGSGAWDFLMWSSISKKFAFRPSTNFSIRFTYRLPGTNDSYFDTSTYKFGKEFQMFFGLSDQFIFLKNLISPSLDFKYRKALKDDIAGFEIDNTGGEWIFVIPNVTFHISQKVLIMTKVEIPVYSNVEGTQLTPTYRISSGIIFRIDTNRKDKFNLISK